MRAFTLVLTAAGLAGVVVYSVLPTARPAAVAPPSLVQPLPAYVPPRGYVCYRACTPVTIDGRLDEAAWLDAPWTDSFVDIEGDAKPRPRFRTRVKMLWDDRYFYIGAELEEPHVWATLTAHDSVIFHDNDFEVFIDADGDSHNYAEFEINALNTGWDLLLTRPYKDGGRALNSWEIPGLKTAVHVAGTLNDPTDTDRGWSVELAFPWKVLGELAAVPAPPVEGNQWRVNFSRVEWKHEVQGGKYRKVANQREDNWVWSPQFAVDMHRPETWGYVQFSTAAPGQAHFQPDPAGPVRHLLHRIYYAQKDYHERRHRWARTLEELGLEQLNRDSLASPPRLEVTETSFEASAPLKSPPGSTVQRWHIRADGRIWTE
jgi:hypothetical protein